MLSLEDVIPLHLADVTFPDSHPLRGQIGQMFAFAIRHRSGLVLFETGIGRGNASLDRYYQVVHRPIELELERHEHRIDDVLDRRPPSLAVGGRAHQLFGGIAVCVQQVGRRIAAVRLLVARGQVDEQVSVARVPQDVPGEVTALEPRMNDHVSPESVGESAGRRRRRSASSGSSGIAPY